MANVTIGELLQEDITNSSKLPFENDSALTKRDDAESISKLSEGPAIVLVSSEADFPAPIGGFIRLGGQTQFKIIAPFTLTTPILLEAGAEISIVTNFLSGNVVNAALGAGLTLFQTLNLSGTILSFADSITDPGVKTTVTTSAAHGLTSDDKVNIFGVATETIYNGNGQTISNVTATTFDIPVVFTSTDTGEFETGVTSFRDEVIFFDLTGFPGTLKAFDLSFAIDTGPAPAAFTLEGGVINFSDLGILRSGDTCVIQNSALLLNAVGLVIDNIGTITISQSSISSSSGAGTGTAITIQGTTVERVTFTDYLPNLASATEFPIRLNGDISATAEISIRNSGGSGIPTDYFDTSAAGLDQTDPRVIAFSNGTRDDSMSSAQVGFTNIATPIVVPIVTQDVPVIIGGTQFVSDSLERATTTTAGQITNLTKKTQDYPITFSGLIEKVGGGSTDIGILLIKNGSLVLTETFQVPHSVNAGVIQISGTRDFELADGDTLDIAVVNFDGTADISVSQANISYSTKS